MVATPVQQGAFVAQRVGVEKDEGYTADVMALGATTSRQVVSNQVANQIQYRS